MLKFDTEKLRRELGQLSREQSVAFATCCAARLAKHVLALSNASLDNTLLQSFCETLELIRLTLPASNENRVKLQEALERCERLSPSEESALQRGHPYAADAFRALIFSLQQALVFHLDTKSAFFAAQVVFEVACDQEQRRLPDGLISARDESEILSSKSVQVELRALESDLAILRASELEPSMLLDMRLKDVC